MSFPGSSQCLAGARKLNPGLKRLNRQGVRRPIFVRSSILWEMDTKFREYGIKVPFPQRDMHFPDDSGLLRPNEPVPEPTDQ